MPSYKTVITVGDVEDKLEMGYSTIDVWASVDQGATYREVTAPSAICAKLYSTPIPPNLEVSGYSFEFSLDGYESQRVTFSGNVPIWTPPMVASKLNESFPGLASVETIGRSQYVVLSSAYTGRATSVECTYSENPEAFPRAKADGRAGRLQLQAGKYIYDFSDPAGKEDTRYKWRFSANGVGPMSDFTFRVFGKLERAPGIPVSVATARFVGLDGQAARRRVIFYDNEIQLSASGTVVGTAGEPAVVEADQSGFLQALLPRGLRVKVAIEGTSFLREIMVPNTPTFDLLQAMALAPDQFTVQTTAPLLTRRSL
jgi:hypothetical protein